MESQHEDLMPTLCPGMRVEVENEITKIRWFADVEIVTYNNVGVITEGPSGWGHLVFDRKSGKTRDEQFKIVRVL